ncbi:MAG: type I phosphomannose isomerase catalytic subunit, partial [Gemmataceae bacterium]
MRDPLRFQPFLRPMVWGGRLLQQFLDKSLPTPESYGESWEISDHPSHLSLVHTGPHAGRTLRQLVDQDSHALIGDSSVKQFPWLVKFLDAHDWLSVQVHPDEEKVRHLLP